MLNFAIWWCVVDNVNKTFGGGFKILSDILISKLWVCQISLSKSVLLNKKEGAENHYFGGKLPSCFDHGSDMGLQRYLDQFSTFVLHLINWQLALNNQEVYIFFYHERIKAWND